MLHRWSLDAEKAKPDRQEDAAKRHCQTHLRKTRNDVRPSKDVADPGEADPRK